MKTIIFDIDGTLTDTKEVDDKCFIQAFHNVFDMDIRSQNWSAFKNVT
ncbi:MAG: HAD family hydrolase, partial [Saprospiraceae bacterium]|nr:HAD family hydrolase [Saprospiraceae bacterium]